MYKDLYHLAVKKDLKKIDKNARDDIKKKTTTSSIDLSGNKYLS